METPVLVLVLVLCGMLLMLTLFLPSLPPSLPLSLPPFAVGVVGIVSVTRAMVAFDRMLRASQHLHDDMIHAVLRAPIR